MKTINSHLDFLQINTLQEIKKLRTNLDNLFILGLYTIEEYKLYLDHLDNCESYLIFKK
jgi:hypothetical protein